MNYDDKYKETKDYFGIEPVGILKEHYRKIDKSKPVLDIGTGQGRNALFLAKEGYEVDAIDESKVSIEIVSALAKKEHLPINTYQSGFETFGEDEKKYACVLLIGLLPLISPDSIRTLQKKLNLWTEKGSLIFVTAFSTDDPSYIKTQESKEWNIIGKNSFGNNNREFRTYFAKGEIIELFPDYIPLYHWEGVSKGHQHGNGKIHQHGMIEVVFQRK